MRVQKTDLFDHLVGAHEQRRRRVEAARLRRPEVDDKFELRGPLHRQIAGLRARGNSVDEYAMRSNRLSKFGSQVQEPAGKVGLTVPGGARSD
jgi:hypothetical protein